MHNTGYENIMMPFREIAEKFKLIDTNTVNIFIDIKESHELINKLRQVFKYGLFLDKKLINKLSQFSVAITHKQLKELNKLGYLDQLDEDIYILNNDLGYNHEYGLVVVEPDGFFC